MSSEQNHAACLERLQNCRMAQQLHDVIGILAQVVPVRKTNDYATHSCYAYEGSGHWMSSCPKNNFSALQINRPPNAFC